MNLYLFGIIFSAVFVLINLYIHKRFVEKLDCRVRTKRYINLFLVINFLGIIGYFLARYYVITPNWLYFLLSLPIGVLFLLFCTTIVYDILRVLLSKLPLRQSRRNFFKRSLDLSSLFVATSLSTKAMVNAKTVTLEKVDIKIKDLKKEYKIVQISDLHVGGLIDKDFVNEIVQKVNLLHPDIVVITGDLVDVQVSYVKETIDELKKLKSTYGTYYIVGNHEYFHGIEEIIKSVKSMGIKVLENENVYIGEKERGFNLAGVYDLFGYRMGVYQPDLQKALENIENSPTLLLAHQPRYIYEVDKRVDLVLSGHTHGGQIYPFGFLVKIVQPYISGLHQHTKDLQIYVNKGTGFWGPPMRLGASAEITEINLQPR